MEINKIYNGDILEMFGKTPDNFIDLIVTSPPYNVGIDYSDWDDRLPVNEYFQWVEKWLSECYRTLKDDGRVAINIPYECNMGERVMISSEYWQIMKGLGFKLFGIVDLVEPAANRHKTSAWGSWMSPSSPYINNPKECVILAYKNSPKKLEKGEPQWDYQEVEVLGKTKRIYTQEQKEEFYELVFGEWNYFNDTRSLTKATFSEDIPSKAMKILTYKGDLVLDCFSGSGTTAVSAKKLGRNFIGFEISPEYHKISLKRLKDLDIQQEVERKSKNFFDFDK